MANTKTRVTNTSGEEKWFSFVPPHGATIANGAHVDVDGDLRTICALREGYGRRVYVNALNHALERGDVAESVVAEPSSSSGAE